MADTAHKTDDEIREYFDDDDVVIAKAAELAALIRDSKHMTAFTGAGISTACGIPDFRGPDGVWTLRAKGETRTKATTSTLKAIPSKTHMALVELMNQGYLKCLISQNTDGLHRKSGIDRTKFAELHGNSNVEKCDRCGKEVLRDFRVRTASKTHDHATGRKCVVPSCGGDLHDSIINFGENLPEAEIDRAFEEGRKSDLCLVLGSSLRVTPAADVPREVGERRDNLVIVNLQKTPLDDLATLRVNTKCDTIMELVMENLGLTIPPFRLTRHLRVSSTGASDLVIEGVDTEGNPYEYLQSVTIKASNKTTGKKLAGDLAVRLRLSTPAPEYQLTLEFMGHYGEPTFTLTHPYEEGGSTVYSFSYTPSTRSWAMV